MAHPEILVVGGNGKVGNAIVHQLVAKGVSVRTTVRDLDSRSDQLAALPGVEVMKANIHDYDEVLASMEGITRAYFVAIFDPYVTVSALAFATAGGCRVS